jgi:hypothetical protein
MLSITQEIKTKTQMSKEIEQVAGSFRTFEQM